MPPPAAEPAGGSVGWFERRGRLLAYGIILLVYLGANVPTMLAHEPWRDEAYAWLIARDAGLGEFFRLRAYEGTPALWYVLLVPFARLGFPYLSMSILHLLLAAGIVALILWRSPFSLTTKALLALSFYLFWEYALEVRVYAVSLFLLFTAAVLYERRHSRPWPYCTCVALIFNGTTHLAPIAGGLLLAYAVELLRSGTRTVKEWVGLGIMAAGPVLLLLQLRPFAALPDANPDGPKLALGAQSVAQVQRSLAEAFFAGVGPPHLVVFAALAVLLLAAWALISRPIPLMILTLHVSGMLALFALTQRGFFRHNGLLLLGVVFCLWIGALHEEWAPFRLPPFASRQAPLIHALNLSLLLSLPLGVAMHASERGGDFSGGKRMAEFIRSNNPGNLPIAAHTSGPAMSVLPYLPGVKLWFAGIQEYGTYVKQNLAHYRNNHNIGTYENALVNIERAFPGGQPVLVLLNVQLDTARMSRYRLLYRVDATVFGSDERLYLYLRSG